MDEVQFFDAPHFDAPLHAVVQGLLAEGHPVTCAGLDLDWRGQPFEVTARPPRHGGRGHEAQGALRGLGPARDQELQEGRRSDVVEIGGGDVYEPRANRHFVPVDPASPAVERSA